MPSTCHPKYVVDTENLEDVSKSLTKDKASGNVTTKTVTATFYTQSDDSDDDQFKDSSLIDVSNVASMGIHLASNTFDMCSNVTVHMDYSYKASKCAGGGSPLASAYKPGSPQTFWSFDTKSTFSKSEVDGVSTLFKCLGPFEKQLTKVKSVKIIYTLRDPDHMFTKNNGKFTTKCGLRVTRKNHA